ncbi:MAG: DUF2889 domain-containing protein [Thermodesulfobacteriota bacterium]
MILSFMRTKVVDVSLGEGGSVRVRWHVSDTWLEALLELEFGVPDLEILEVTGQIQRAPYQECQRAGELLPKILGVRVGPGLRKIVGGLLGGEAGCTELAEGVLEACNALIIHFTVPRLRVIEEGQEDEKVERLREMLRLNPRLRGSCVAFRDGSPLVEGL